jgi:TniQ
MAMHGDISFVPEVLPIAPRPIVGELISSWHLRVSFANGLTLAELVQGIKARFPEVPFRGAFIDDQLSPSARSALAKFLRVTEHEIKALELRQQFPILPMEWILRSIDWELGSPHRFVQGRAMYAFCPICIQEMSRRTRTVWIRSVSGHSCSRPTVRDTARLCLRPVASVREDPLEITNPPVRDKSLQLAPCWNCGSSLLLYDPEPASPAVAEIIDLESAILTAVLGKSPDPRWSGRLSAKAFTDKLRFLMRHLTMTTTKE